jgi:hypothetical protein
MLMKLSRRVVAVSILASVIGGLMSVLVFQIESPPGFLEYLVLPGTIAFLFVTEGHAGAPHWALAISPAIVVVVNMLVYAIAVIGISKILNLITRKESI